VIALLRTCFPDPDLHLNMDGNPIHQSIHGKR